MMGVGGIQQPASQQSPDYPLALSKIQVMSKQELDDLLNDDEKFDDYIRSLQQIMQLYSEKEELMTSNKSLAEYNLSQEPDVRSKRETLAEKHREAIAMVETLKKTRAELESKSGSYKPDELYSLLQVSSTEVEQESEKLADEFLEGDGSGSNVDAFLDKFMEKRRLYHMRHAKVTQLKEIIERKNINLTPSRRAPQAPHQNATPQDSYNPSMNMMQNSVPPPGQQAYRSNIPYSITSPMGAPPPTNNWSAYGQPQLSSQMGNLPYPVQAPTGMPAYRPPY